MNSAQKFNSISDSSKDMFIDRHSAEIDNINTLLLLLLVIIIIIIIILIDVAIPSDRNVMQESEKKLKYKHLSIEIQRMWNMKCFVTLVIIGATGIVTKGLKNI
jgi:hypothetical protein